MDGAEKSALFPFLMQPVWSGQTASNILPIAFEGECDPTGHRGELQYAMPSEENSGPGVLPSAAAFKRNISSPQVVLQETK